MRVAAISMGGIRFKPLLGYREDLGALLSSLQVRLAALPAHVSFKLWWGDRSDAGKEAYAAFREKAADWNSDFLELHGELARAHRIYLVAGTTLEEEGGHVYQTMYMFSPEGDLLGCQRQTHLDREEREFGLSRGTELNLFPVDGLRVGLVCGNDARHPEVGRILALQGCDIAVHAGALSGEEGGWHQVAGMWSQVQQNQFWGVEAQLWGEAAGRVYNGCCAVLGPCEITPGQTGFLERGEPGAKAAFALLEEEKRRRLTEGYPLLALLNPAAYEQPE